LLARLLNDDCDSKLDPRWPQQGESRRAAYRVFQLLSIVLFSELTHREDLSAHQPVLARTSGDKQLPAYVSNTPGMPLDDRFVTAPKTMLHPDITDFARCWVIQQRIEESPKLEYVLEIEVLWGRPLASEVLPLESTF
jgi:hypothetical protein